MVGATVDQINFALLLLAALLSWFFPFELLLIAYAFLGPLHYLTEISWLHDRKYFTVRPYDPWILTGMSLITLLFGAAVLSNSSELIWLLLLMAFCMAFIHSWTKRLVILLLGGLCLLPFVGSVSSYTMSVLIPTVLHVFLFTALFMLLGALKNRAKLGYINTAVFVGISGLLLIIPSKSIVFPNFVAEYYQYFEGIARVVSSAFAIDATTTVIHLATFLSFTYTYHYLNWFSKTSIIEWHKISRSRAAVIVLLYILSVGIYVYDYRVGLSVLLTLSFLHVVLEFPLNFKSAQGIYREISARSNLKVK